ncbi:unnamed protein product [Discula destructiva]
MAPQIFETFSRDEVTDDMVAQAAKLFSENYGIWGKQSAHPGKRVRLNAQRLRDQYLPVGTHSSYSSVRINGNLAGNVFACRWSYGGKNICWITQLVVHKDYRMRGLARALLNLLMEETDDVFGVMSSHPAACMAAATSYGRGIERISLDFIQQNASTFLESSPIEYIRDARPCGSLFEENSNGMVAGVNSGFFVDHEEPLEALSIIQADELHWPLGDLPDGSEFLLLIPRSQHRSRSRSWNKPESS